MYLAHANHAPRKLTRVADDNWTLTTVQWEYPPVLDQNITPVTIASSAATGTATLTASASTFQSGHVGSSVGHPVAADQWRDQRNNQR
jgi:hypothetical protein